MANKGNAIAREKLHRRFVTHHFTVSHIPALQYMVGLKGVKPQAFEGDYDYTDATGVEEV